MATDNQNSDEFDQTIARCAVLAAVFNRSFFDCCPILAMPANLVVHERVKALYALHCQSYTPVFTEMDAFKLANGCLVNPVDLDLMAALYKQGREQEPKNDRRWWEFWK